MKNQSSSATVLAKSKKKSSSIFPHSKHQVAKKGLAYLDLEKCGDFRFFVAYFTKKDSAMALVGNLLFAVLAAVGLLFVATGFLSIFDFNHIFNDGPSLAFVEAGFSALRVVSPIVFGIAITGVIYFHLREKAIVKRVYNRYPQLAFIVDKRTQGEEHFLTLQKLFNTERKNLLKQEEKFFEETKAYESKKLEKTISAAISATSSSSIDNQKRAFYNEQLQQEQMGE